MDEEGRNLSSEITGDHNADLRIFRTDVTAYPTLDPLGNNASYRPRTRSDRAVIAPYHSTEDDFLVAVLEWINQGEISAKALENDAKETIEWIKSMGQRGGFTTEHFFGAPDDFRTISAFHFGEKIPKIGERSSGEYSPYGMVASPETAYHFYTNQKKELVIATRRNSDTIEKEKISVLASFASEEADHLVKGILYQAARGLGRTSAAQLVSILNYRFSPQYKKDLTEFGR